MPITEKLQTKWQPENARADSVMANQFPRMAKQAAETPPIVPPDIAEDGEISRHERVY